MSCSRQSLYPSFLSLALRSFSFFKSSSSIVLLPLSYPRLSLSYRFDFAIILIATVAQIAVLSAANLDSFTLDAGKQKKNIENKSKHNN